MLCTLFKKTNKDSLIFDSSKIPHETDNFRKTFIHSIVKNNRSVASSSGVGTIYVSFSNIECMRD